MKFVLLALGVAGGCLLSAEEVSLTELPATASRAFWTWNGTALPFSNRNLSGGTIRIGKIRYPHGICGHTPFSNIYVLNGTACSFSAEIGVEMTDHPGDPVRPGDPLPQVTFQFFADFKEIFRKRCTLGDSPFPVRLDLTGICHFEIRAKASGGRTSHRCRTAIGNPVFHTVDPQRMKQVLRKQADWRIEPESYPAAPEWKNIAIEKILYGNYSGAYRIRTTSYELVIVPECGGRALWLSRLNGENLFAPELPCRRRKMLIWGGFPDCASGHFLRLLPQELLLPDDPVLETAPYSVSFPENGVIVMRSQRSRVHGIRVEYHYRILPDAVEVTGLIRNESPFPRPLGVWCLTRVDTRKLCRLSASGIVVRPESLNPEREFPFSDKVVLTAWFQGGEQLEIHADRGTVKFFRSPRFTELEILGEIAVSPSGGCVKLREIWLLR